MSRVTVPAEVRGVSRGDSAATVAVRVLCGCRRWERLHGGGRLPAWQGKRVCDSRSTAVEPISPTRRKT